MHRMLGVLRLQNGGAPELEPQPGVRELPTLIERTRQAGLEADALRGGGAARAAGRGGPVVFRIVQEALTNVIRHAHAHRATVTWATPPTPWR